MPTPANEPTINRLLVVAEAQEVYVEAARCFADLDLPVDRTRSFETANILLAHLPYAAIVVHYGGELGPCQEQLWRLQGLLQCAKGTPVVLLTTGALPERAAQAITKNVSLYFDRQTSLAEIADAVRCLLHLASKRSDVGGEGTRTNGRCASSRPGRALAAPTQNGRGQGVASG